MMVFIVVVLLLMSAAMLGVAQGVVAECNPLCTCSQRDVSCIGVPFAEVPPLPLDDLFQLTILRAGLEVIHDHSFQKARISSLRLMQNGVSSIGARAFEGSERALTTLDLSFNHLHRVPAEPLHTLQQLQWLSLHGNEIDEVGGLGALPSLRSLFLGANALCGALGEFSTSPLTALDLDHNRLEQVGTLPPSLATLSVANNLLTRLPPLQHLANLTWLQLGGNLLEEVSGPLPPGHLHKLDLSHNLLRELPPLLNGSVANLHLEFNFISKGGGQGALVGLRGLERLSLANNRLRALPPLPTTLRALDLSHNLLEAFPAPLEAPLTHLFLRGNLISDLEPQALHGCRFDLEVLDLSSNRLSGVPGPALSATQRLSRLSLQDNAISEVGAVGAWGRSLTALNLANNRLRTLHPSAFAEAGRLRELRLSYNPLLAIDPLLLQPLKASLEVFEAGSFHAPLQLLQGLEKVKWLQLDHAGLTSLPASSFSGMGSLIHVDLSGNRVAALPSGGLFRGPEHPRLNSVVLAHAGLSGPLPPDAFHKLPSLTSAVLFGNRRLVALRSLAFHDLPLLNTLVLASNGIERIEAAAFAKLRSLNNLFLQDNNLTELSLGWFRGVGSHKSPLSLDVSRNRISRLSSSPEGVAEGVHLRTLDLSDNLLEGVQGEALPPSLHTLLLSRNRIASLEQRSFHNLHRLQVLQLDGNELSHLGNGALSACSQLQSLSLASNQLQALMPGALRNLSTLRILDLAHNRLKALPEALLVGAAASLERLNLSHNNIFHAPTHALQHARATLRYLDLSSNRIATLPTHGLGQLQALLGLNLSSNQLTSLSEDAFAKLHYLLHLDLSHNTLHRLDEAPFKTLVSLQTLSLRDASLSSVPPLSLPSLRRLDLSRNLLTNASFSWGGLPHLRRLLLARNRLAEVPSWGGSLSRLTHLDLSGNPIQTLSMNAFRRLERLRDLDLRSLDLKYLDARVLHPLKFLQSFSTSTYAGLRSFRLQNLLSKACGLKRALVEVEESTLSHQLQWTFGAKLRELTITGNNLQHVLPDAFQGLRSHELVLRITGTSVSRLPPGLLRYLADVRYLTLDVRGNRLSSLDPRTLAPPPHHHPDTTQHISGGVLLSDNPWACGCGLVWLGGWVRRWMRETLRIQMLHFDGFLYAHALARQATCTTADNRTLPLVDLDPDEWGCPPLDDQPSSSSATSPQATLLLVATAWLLRTLW